MTQLCIQDLETSNTLDQHALVAVKGGANQAGNIAANGGVTSLISFGGGGGINLFSPQILVNTVISAPVTIQLASVLEQLQQIDTTSIINSVLAG
jgi:hypothetical protein